MKIPLVNLENQFNKIQEEINEAIHKVLKSGHYILGPNVEALEEEVASYCGVSYGVGVASGTDALRLSLLALEIGEGDEVITTPFTFIATAQVINQVGATPVFVDIDERTFNLNVARIEEVITPRTKAIVPVHLFGHPVDMRNLLAIAGRYNLAVVEDAAQSFGSQCNLGKSSNGLCWKKTGSIGDVGCFSFFPTKNLGGFGDGGMVITDSEEIATRIRLLRAHGGNSDNYSYIGIGYNSRLDELQAAILRVKLKYVDQWIKQRKEKASIYDRLLSDSPVTVPYREDYATHTFCVYTIKALYRDTLRKHLEKKGIATKIYYPHPIYLQVPYRDLNYQREDFPVTEKICREVLSLPIYPELEKDKIQYIAKNIIEFFKSGDTRIKE